MHVPIIFFCLRICGVRTSNSYVSKKIKETWHLFNSSIVKTMSLKVSCWTITKRYWDIKIEIERANETRMLVVFLKDIHIYLYQYHIKRTISRILYILILSFISYYSAYFTFRMYRDATVKVNVCVCIWVQSRLGYVKHHNVLYGHNLLCDRYL